MKYTVVMLDSEARDSRKFWTCYCEADHTNRAVDECGKHLAKEIGGTSFQNQFLPIFVGAGHIDNRNNIANITTVK